MKAINIKPLYELVVLKDKMGKEEQETLKQRIDPEELIRASMDFYVGIKAVGIGELDVIVDYGEDGRIDMKAINLPAKVRAMAEYIFILISRSKELDTMQTAPTRLDRHYGLTASLEDVLGDKMIKRGNSELDIISVQDVIDMWFKA